MDALWFCFAGIIQQDLDFVRDHWNTHTIRASSHDTICEKPDEPYLLPKRKRWGTQAASCFGTRD